MKRVMLAAALAAVILTPLFWLSGPTDRREGLLEGFGTTMDDVSVVSRQDGRVLWSLKTEQATIPGEGTTARLSDVTVDMPAEGIVVTSNEGSFGLNDGDLSLMGGVKAQTSRYTIITESIDVDAESGAITSRERVVMEGDGIRVVGRGLKALGGKVWLLDGVKAEFF